MLAGNRDCVGKSLGNTEAEAEGTRRFAWQHSTISGQRTAIRPQTGFPPASPVIFFPFHTDLPLLPKMTSLNNAQAWERRAFVGFSSAGGGRQSGGSGRLLARRWLDPPGLQESCANR